MLHIEYIMNRPDTHQNSTAFAFSILDCPFEVEWLIFDGISAKLTKEKTFQIAGFLITFAKLSFLEVHFRSAKFNPNVWLSYKTAVQNRFARHQKQWLFFYCFKTYMENCHFRVFLMISINQSLVFPKDYVHSHQMRSHFRGGYRLDFSLTEHEFWWN